jgi:hypothetical protein
MIRIIWHLLVNGEKCAEEGFEKTARRIRVSMVVMFLWKGQLRF